MNFINLADNIYIAHKNGYILTSTKTETSDKAKNPGAEVFTPVKTYLKASHAVTGIKRNYGFDVIESDVLEAYAQAKAADLADLKAGKTESEE